MSILLTRVLWYRANDSDVVIDITDLLNFQSGRGLKIQNNTISLTLKNTMNSFDSNYNYVHEYVDSFFNIMFAENDVLEIYVRYTDDASDIGTDAWTIDTDEYPDGEYLLGTYYIIEYTTKLTSKSVPITVTAVDKTYVMFNKLHAKYYNLESTSGTTTSTTASKLVDSSAKFITTANVGMYVENTTDETKTYITAIDSDTTLSINDDIFVSGEDYSLKWNSPSILQKVIRFATEEEGGRYSGSGADSGVKFAVDAKTISEGGYIQDERSDGTPFPPISMSKIWKPVYEWVDELSQIENLNTETEISDEDYLYGRSFRYYIDENNVFHWFEASQTVDTTIDVQTATGIYNYDFNKSVFDSINFVVGRGGSDLYGNGTLDYYFEPSSKVKTLRMKVFPMTEIANDLIDKEIANGNLVENNTDGVFTYGGNRYDRSGTVTPHWSTTSYSTDSTYNDSLRAEIRKTIKKRSQRIVSKLAGQRWKGTIEFKGQHATIGSIYKITSRKNGMIDQVIRCVDIKHIINKQGWFTTLSFEEDEEAINAGS